MASAAARRTVCLLSTHPLILPELQRYLASLRHKSVSRLLKITSTTNVHRVPLPVAPVYVVDSHSIGPATEGLIAGIRYRHKRRRVIVLVDEIEELQCFPLLSLGVKGLMRYSDVPRQLARAVRFVANGGIWVPREVMVHYLERAQSVSRARMLSTTGAKSLSRREKEVWGLLLKGLANKEIAASLHISESTVKFHVSNIISRFGVQRRADLILQSLQETGAIQ